MFGKHEMTLLVDSLPLFLACRLNIIIETLRSGWSIRCYACRLEEVKVALVYVAQSVDKHVRLASLCREHAHAALERQHSRCFSLTVQLRRYLKISSDRSRLENPLHLRPS